MDEEIRAIEEIQMYIHEKIKSNRYLYTTIDYDSKQDVLLDLVLNWIEYEMELRSLKNTL